jgi:hypothetical protein
MNEQFESKADEKVKIAKTSHHNRDNEPTVEGTEVDEDAAKGDKAVKAILEETLHPEQSAEAKEIERRLKELGKEMNENKMCIIAGCLLKKEASLFFKVVNLLKLIDIIFVFSLTMTPMMLLALFNLAVNLLLYYKNCNAITIPVKQVFIAIVVMFSSLIVLSEELKTDYRRLSTSEFMPLFLPFLGLWTVQTVIWTAQLIVVFHQYLKPSAKEQSDSKKPELEASQANQSHLMMSQNMSKADLEADGGFAGHSIPVSQSTDKVSTGDDPASSDRGGTKKLKRRPKDNKP